MLKERYKGQKRRERRNQRQDRLDSVKKSNLGRQRARLARKEHEKRLIGLGAGIFAAFTFMVLLLALGGCGPANKQRNPTEFYDIGLVAPAIWLHVDKRATRQNRDWAENSVRSFDGHYGTWRANYGARNHTRRVDLYIYKLPVLESPQRVAVAAFTVADPNRPRDEIHCILGEKGILGSGNGPLARGLLSELHQASLPLQQRDYYYIDASLDWATIFGQTPLTAGPSPVFHTPGLLEEVLDRLRARR